jgi:hypothetical protein
MISAHDKGKSVMKTLAVVLTMAFAMSFAGGSFAKSGNVSLLKDKYDEVGNFQRIATLGLDVARARSGSKWGYVGQDGSIVIPFDWDYAGPFAYVGRSLYRAVVKKDGRYGFINEKGEEVIPLRFDKVEVDFFNNGESYRARVLLGGRSFVIDSSGREIPLSVIYCILSETKVWTGDGWLKLLRVSQGGRQEISRGQGYAIDPMRPRGMSPYVKDLNMHIPVFYEDTTDFVPMRSGDKMINIARVKRGGRYGFINEKGEEVVPVIYDELDFFKNMGERFIARAKREGRVGYINEQNEAVIPFIYEEGYSFYHDEKDGVVARSVAVRRGGRWGYIDYTGSVSIPIMYDRIDSFQKIDVAGRIVTLAMVERDGKRGFMDSTGRIVIPIEFEMARPFQTIRSSEGILNIAAVRRGGRWGFVDPDGRTILPFEYDEVNRFNSVAGKNIVRVKLRGEWIYIDDTGKTIDDEWDVDFSRNRGSADDQKARNGGPGKGVQQRISNNISLRDGGKRTEVTPLQRDGKWGMVDNKGKILVPVTYDEIGAFIKINQEQKAGKNAGKSCGLPDVVKVKRNGKWGYADLCGNEYLSAVYDELPDTLPTTLQFHRIKKDGKYGYLGRTGIEILPAKYDEAPVYLQSSGQKDTMRRVKAGGLYGYISISTGSEIIPPRFEYAPEYFTGEKARVKLNGNWGYVDKTGNGLGSFRREDDPCIFEKSSGELYLFNDQAVIRAKPGAASDILAMPAPGEKVLIGSRTDVEFSTGNETDFWYTAAYGGEKGYVWGGDIADSDYWITVKGKKVQILILNRTNGMDRCYAPTFRIRMISDGRVVSEFSGHPFVWGTVSDVKSVEYVRMEGFSAPLKLLRIKYSVKGYKDTYARSGTGEVYFYIGEGKLKKVLELGDASGWSDGVPVGFSTEVQYPDQTGQIDTLKITVKASAALVIRKVFNEYTRKWDWEKKTFGGE